ncbi:prion-inhibition and propagation-domain-containing protein [Pyrenochaeta sp. MPI-SDFR-AT-0127]|nr:prion-inhibition and propagation-domain-containing protein [Pyrenochaeta sp. MPI-SDFR-AT-0127]
MADVVSIVALSLTCFHGCVKGLVVLSKAKHYNRDVSDVRLQTELILHSLTTWAQEAGLTQDPPTLLISAHNAAFVPGILGQLETLLSDINVLRQRYGIYLQPTDEDVDSVDDDASILLSSDSQRRRWTGKIDVAVFLKRKEPWKRLKWVTLDDKKFDRLLDRAKGYVAELGKFLEQARQDRMERHLEFCLRTAILHADGEHELGVLGREFQKTESKVAVSAAARLKQSRLKLGILESNPEPSTTALTKSISAVSMGSSHDSTIYEARSDPVKDMKLSMRFLTLGRAARAERLRTLAQYDGVTVLLEWKYVTTMKDSTIIRRVNQVAGFLQNMGSTLHSLQCRGFVEDHIAKRYGYIFDLPHDLSFTSRRSLSFDNIARRPPPAPELRSLRQMLDQSTLPSLNARLTLAVTFLETLLNLHTSGWLHKELRSDNIILIRKPESHSRISTTTSTDLSDYSVYIAGYVYSRVDNPGELTEPLESDLEADLYRHPSSLYGSRQPYRKSLDIFSVGCTLLEIGLWMGLRQILMKYSPSSAKSQHKTKAALPSIYERSFSDPTLAHRISSLDQDEFRQHGSELDRKAKRPLDLMELKHELLLSQFTKRRSTHEQPGINQSSRTAADRSLIMSSLEAAMGKRYTTIVEEFLAAANTVKELKEDEHEFALDLEMKARDTMRAIADAM